MTELPISAMQHAIVALEWSLPAARFAGLGPSHQAAIEALRAALKETMSPKSVSGTSQPNAEGPSGDRLSDFRSSQWWLPELDAAVANGTDDQKRAVAVVRNLLKTVDALAQPQAQPAKPQNCGTSYCSCIECVMEPAQHIPLTDEQWQVISDVTNSILTRKMKDQIEAAITKE